MVIEGWVIAVILIVVIGFIIFAVFRIVDSYRHQTTTGKEDLKGKTVEVRESLNPEGTVFYEGELWRAVSDSGTVESGEEVVITKIEGLKLRVTKKTKE
jgi:membrane-bound serine protease (ClpP class)